MAWDSDADIKGVFAQFGYTPTEAEIASLRPSFGEGMGGAVATSAVGQYVNFKNAEKERMANDPLNALQTRMNGIIDQNVHDKWYGNPSDLALGQALALGHTVQQLMRSA